MNNFCNILSISALWGLTALLVLFVVCALLVIGVKLLFYFAEAPATPQKPEPEPIKKIPPKKSAKPKTKSLVIDPDEIGRIYVRKSER